MVFTWNMRNLIIHISVYMILTVSRFLIICVKLCLDFSPSQPLCSAPVKKPGSGVYRQQYPEARTTKRVQHIQDIFSSSGFTEPNIVRPDNQNYEAGYQPAQSTRGFPVQLRARSCERGGLLITSDIIRTMNEDDMR